MATVVSRSTTNDDNVILKTGKQEVDRLDTQHIVIREAMGSLVLAPIDLSKPGLRILDQATGGGIWLHDMKSTSPARHTYVGTDIVDDYFPSEPVPDMSFHNQSMTEPWPDSWAGSFDLVHSRFALAGAGTNSIREVVKRLFALVKPGGYIQLVENAFEEPPNGAAARAFVETISSMFSLVTGGQFGNLRADAARWLQEAGMEGVEDRLVTVPLGLSAKSGELNELSITSIVSTASGISETAKQMPPFGVPLDIIEALPKQLGKELGEQGGAYQIFVLWGRKPLSA